MQTHLKAVLQSLLPLIPVISSLIFSNSANTQESESGSLTSVIVEDIIEKDVTPEYRHVGRVVAINTVTIRARVQAVIENRNFTEGHIVKKGDLLFTLEKLPFEVVVDQRKADLAAAEANLANANANFERIKKLRRRDAASQADLDEAKATKLTAEAEVLRAKAALKAAELDLSYTEIYSPIDGKISTATYSTGNLVSSNSEPLATITSVDPVYVTINLSEKNMIEARKRGIDLENPPVAPTLRLSDGSEYEFPGEFNYLSPDVNQSTDTVIARAQFPNHKGILLAGQFVTVVVRPKETIEAVVVPQIAVQRDSDGYFVLVVNRANKVEVRRITADRQIDTDWVVSDGLVSGEKIITQGIQKVRPEMIVNPISATDSESVK